jgi:hypothetical protein
VRERDVDGCTGWLDHAIGRGMVINREEVGFSESILIVSVSHRIYIDCFCARDLLESIFDCGYFSESLLFISDCHRIFQNQYFLLLLFRIYIDYFWVSQNLYWLFLCARERCGRLQRMYGSCNRTGDGNKLRGGCPFRINIDNFCISQNLYWLFLHPWLFRINIVCGCFSESLLFISVRLKIYIHCFCAR